MDNYSVWALIRRSGAQYEVKVRAIPLRGTLIQPGDVLTETCESLAAATLARDGLVKRVCNTVATRGDHVASVDSTLEM